MNNVNQGHPHTLLPNRHFDPCTHKSIRDDSGNFQQSVTNSVNQHNFHESTSGAKSIPDMMQEQLYMFIRYLIEEIKLRGGSVSIGGDMKNTNPNSDYQNLLDRAHIANGIGNSTILNPHNSSIQHQPSQDIQEHQ